MIWVLYVEVKKVELILIFVYFLGCEYWIVVVLVAVGSGGIWD